MSDLLSLDYDTARPASYAAVKAAGYTAVWRYLDGGSVPGKSLTPAEAAEIHGAELGIGLIWETVATRALGGGPAGSTDGRAARGQALGIGVAPGSPVLANLGDFQATAAQIGAIHAYYYGFRTALGPYQPGGYATGYIIDQLVAGGAIGLWWQNAMDDGGLAGSVVSPHASVYQRTGHTHTIAGFPDSDWDEDAFGLGPDRPHWWMPGAPPPPPPPAELEGILVQLPAGAARKVLSADAGKSWH